MINYLIRTIKRFLVLVPGLVVTYFVVKDLYPALDRRIPATLAILTAYLIAAYALIPTLLRFIRILFPPNHIPHYCTTPDGFASDPINIGVEASREDLIEAMTAAGWHQAHRKTLKSMIRFGVAMLFKKSYKNAPFSTLFLFGRGQDIGFQLPVADDVRLRHHVRFWATHFTDDPRHHDHVFFWRKFRSGATKEKVLWVGAASLDNGLAIIRHNFQITHMIDPDTNAERELIVSQLMRTGKVKKVRTVQIDNPYTLPNRAFRGYLHTDGKMKIVELRAKS